MVAELRDAHPQSIIVERYLLSGPVDCDLGRVQQLVSNLVGNALAYGGSIQPVEVEGSVDQGSLTIAVANGGDPIAPPDLDRIFEPFWRPADSAPGGGLGLGLHICSQIVRAHGGTLEVRSSKEAGTRFTATLPARQVVN